ncbi:MAG TPA: DNA alkylation repair protein [Archangium sp.]
MGEPFKNLIGPKQVDWLAERLVGAWKAFPAAEFKKLARKGLEDLELKARARHLADALEATLPKDAARAFGVLSRAMENPLEVTEGYGGSVFRYLAISEFLERHGPEDLEAALKANYELTQRFSSEFCIRSLILAAPERVLGELSRWAADPNPHVRRLVSEGTRPRLPWGRQLTPFIEDPSPVLPLLEKLKDDDSEYVRRSASNNLNDIAKDHPEVVLKVAKAWLQGASDERRKLVEHGLRTLLKRGDPRALALIGAHGAESLEVSGKVSPGKVKLGERVVFSATVKNVGKAKLHAVLEARVHFVKVRGTSVKPFRLARLDVAPGQQVEVTKSFELQHRSIRRLFSGVHEVELQVNGARSPMGRFVLSV